MALSISAPSVYFCKAEKIEPKDDTERKTIGSVPAERRYCYDIKLVFVVVIRMVFSYIKISINGLAPSPIQYRLDNLHSIYFGIGEYIENFY